MKIGFIGLGNMGYHMARNLHKAGNTMMIFDINKASIDKFVSESGDLVKIAASPKEIAQAGMDVLITMLPASQHVRSVYHGLDGILSANGNSAVLIDSSTIDPQTAREIANLAKDKGLRMIDAPVSGGTGGAEAGTLTFMVGGDELVFAEMKPILQVMGKNIVYCGGSGNGQVAKVANNMLLGISMIATAEAMSLGVSLGMDPKVLAGIINTSSGRCWSSEIYNPYPGVLENVPSARGYSGGFGVDLMLKDLGLATEAAKSAKQSVPLGSLAQQTYQMFSSQGFGSLDFSAIIKLFNKK